MTGKPKPFMLDLAREDKGIIYCQLVLITRRQRVYERGLLSA